MRNKFDRDFVLKKNEKSLDATIQICTYFVVIKGAHKTANLLYIHNFLPNAFSLSDM